MSQVGSLGYANPLLYVDPTADADESGFGLACAYARANQTPLTVVSAVGERSWSLLGHSDRAEAAFHEIVGHAKEKLASMSARASSEGVEVHTELLEGTPYVEVIRKVIDGGHDLVIKTMLGAAENANTLYGAMARKLIRKSPGTVLLVHPAFESIKRVVVALGSHAASESITSDVAHAGEAWSQFSGTPLHVLHAWSVYGESLMTRRMTSNEFYGYVAAEREAARAHVNDALTDIGLVVAQDRVHLEEGRPEAVIPAFASDPKSDLLVLGSVARAGMSGLLLGNTAESILQNVNCSILVVKPKDFVSPLA